MLAALLGCAPGIAKAELPRPYGETTGFMFEGSFSVNGVTTDDYVDDITVNDIDRGALVGLGLAGAYRPIDYVSVGLLAHFGFLNPDVEGADEEQAGFLGLLAEVRGFLPMDRFEPWLGLGFGYAMTYGVAEGEYTIPFLGDIDYQYRLTLHGVGMSVGTGLNIYITERLAVGAFFRMILGGWISGCWETTIEGDHEDECDDLEDLYNVDDRDDLPDMPHLWIVGATVSYIM